MHIQVFLLYTIVAARWGIKGHIQTDIQKYTHTFYSNDNNGNIIIKYYYQTYNIVLNTILLLNIIIKYYQNNNVSPCKDITDNLTVLELRIG